MKTDWSDTVSPKLLATPPARKTQRAGPASRHRVWVCCHLALVSGTMGQEVTAKPLSFVMAVMADRTATPGTFQEMSRWARQVSDTDKPRSQCTQDVSKLTLMQVAGTSGQMSVAGTNPLSKDLGISAEFTE